MNANASRPRARYAEDVDNAVEAAREELIAVSLDIHAHPEVGDEEHHAADVLAGFLERHGFDVERGVGGVPTAFRGTSTGAGGGGPTVAILAEYDALPAIGHGCGHNLIALTAIGAGVGAKAALGSLPGRILVIGTPAEENNGGKIRLLGAGVFRGVDVALSSHPSANRTIIPTDVPLGQSLSLAWVGYRYVYHGRAAHAASAPHAGVNALNAVIHLFTGIDAVRQHLRDDVRIHGIITDGGKAPNVVPDFAAANFLLRAADREYLTVVETRVRAVAEGAAAMTGARLEVLPANPFYEDKLPNTPLAQAAKANAALVGLAVDDVPPEQQRSSASTDLGNVSHAIPTFAVRFKVSESPVPGHSIAMTEAAASALAHESAIAVAKVLALTACDVLSQPGLLARARADFEARARR